MELLIAIAAAAAIAAAFVMVAKAQAIGDLPGIPRVASWSPNRSPRNNAPVTMLVWHYTAGPTMAGAVSWLCNPASRASAHFVIGRDGSTIQLVPLADSAWHVGEADIGNARTIGVELVNVGRVEPNGKGGWTYDTAEGKAPINPDLEPQRKALRWEGGKVVDAWWVPFTKAQGEAMRRLVSALESSPWHSATLDMRGHEDIARPVGRKTDPGPLFPWSLFPGRHAARQTMVV